MPHTHATKASIGGHNTPEGGLGSCGELRAALGPVLGQRFPSCRSNVRLGLAGVGGHNPRSEQEHKPMRHQPLYS